MVFLELRWDSRVMTGNSGFLLCWPREVQSSIRVSTEDVLTSVLLLSDVVPPDVILPCSPNVVSAEADPATTENVIPYLDISEVSTPISTIDSDNAVTLPVALIFPSINISESASLIASGS